MQILNDISENHLERKERPYKNQQLQCKKKHKNSAYTQMKTAKIAKTNLTTMLTEDPKIASVNEQGDCLESPQISIQMKFTEHLSFQNPLATYIPLCTKYYDTPCYIKYSENSF